MEIFLRKCVFERPMELPEEKGRLKQGADSVNVRVIKDEQKECIIEAEIIKRVPNLFNIELVYQAECEKDESCEDCNAESQFRTMLILEANLLVSNMLKEMDFPPFPVILGDLREKDKTNERNKHSRKKG